MEKPIEVRDGNTPNTECTQCVFATFNEVKKCYNCEFASVVTNWDNNLSGHVIDTCGEKCDYYVEGNPKKI